MSALLHYLKCSLVFCVLFISIISTHNASAAEKNLFKLHGVHGVVSDQDFSGDFILLTFGYTSCPDICPTTLYDLDRIYKKVQHKDRLKVVFVSIDPTVDTPKRVQAYVDSFNKTFIGLTADYETLKKMAVEYGASFGYRVGSKQVSPPNMPAAYTVYHSTLIYLISPDRHIIDAFDYQEDNDKIFSAVDEAMSRQQPAGASRREAGSATTSSQAGGQPAEVDLPPGFEPYRGQALGLEDFGLEAQDGVALVSLWASWCAPCHKEIPLLDSFAAQQSSIKILPVNFDEDRSSAQKAWAAFEPKHLKTVYLKDEDILSKTGGKGLPLAILFRHGKAVGMKNGEIKEVDSLAAWAEKH